AALAEHPAVRECAVLAREDRAGGLRLVAYAVPRGNGLSVDELRASLRRRLPEPMIPAAFVVLAALPLTASGKLDRRALPAPLSHTTAAAGPRVAPRTPVEAVIAAVWREVLSLPAVGVEESFFDLGGHSLLATRVVSRLRTALGVEIPVRALFEAPTIAGL